jgi:hypothetical protein
METIHEDGVWWDPRHPNEQWPGRLRFNENEGAILSIIVPAGKSEFFPRRLSYMFHARVQCLKPSFVFWIPLIMRTALERLFQLEETATR